MTQEHLPPFAPADLPASTDPLAASAALYATEVAEDLFSLLVEVVKVRHPALADLFCLGIFQSKGLFNSLASAA